MHKYTLAMQQTTSKGEADGRIISGVRKSIFIKEKML